MELMWLNPPPQYKLNKEEKYPDMMSAVSHSILKALKESCKHGGRALVGRTGQALSGKTSKNLGWSVGMAPPVVQEMKREFERTHSDPTLMVPVIQEVDAYEGKAWSVAY